MGALRRVVAIATHLNKGTRAKNAIPRNVGFAVRGSVIDAVWLRAVLAHYPPPRVTEER